MNGTSGTVGSMDRGIEPVGGPAMNGGTRVVTTRLNMRDRRAVGVGRTAQDSVTASAGRRGDPKLPGKVEQSRRRLLHRQAVVETAHAIERTLNRTGIDA